MAIKAIADLFLHEFHIFADPLMDEDYVAGKAREEAGVDENLSTFSLDKSWKKEWADFIPDDHLTGTCWDAPAWLEDYETDSGAISSRLWCKTMEDWEEALTNCYENLERAKSWGGSDPGRQPAISRMNQQIQYCKEQIEKFENGKEDPKED